MPRRTSALTIATATAVLLTLVGYHWPSLWLVYLSKPLATLFLIFVALDPWTRHRPGYSWWIVVGLVFSLAGDTFLLWPDHYFPEGLTAFLLTHVAYLLAFTRDCEFPAYLPVWLACLLLAALFYAILFPALPVGLRVPVALYAVLLSAMTGQATGRFLRQKTTCAQYAAVGSLLFLLSDLLLSYHRFRHPLFYSTILILVPYYSGQCLIALSASQPQLKNQTG